MAKDSKLHISVFKRELRNVKKLLSPIFFFRKSSNLNFNGPMRKTKNYQKFNDHSFAIIYPILKIQNPSDPY